MRQIYVDNNAASHIHKISFYTNSSGYVAFANAIGFTTDSGRTFTKKYITFSNVNYNGHSVNLTFGFGINGVKAFHQDTLIVYGDYGLVPSILYSTDAGASYTLVLHSRHDPFVINTGITDMIFPENNNIGYAVDADRILKTTNKGQTWSIIRTDPNSFFDQLGAINNNIVYASSSKYNASKLLRTTNGTHWSVVNLPSLTNAELNSFNFLTATKGWINIYRNNVGEVYYTSNSGSSWTMQNDPDAGSFGTNKMKFVNDSTGYALYGFDVYKTTDSGRIWQPMIRDNNYSYLGYTHNDLFFASNDQFWAGGGHGFLEINTNATVTPLFPKAAFKIDTVSLHLTNTVKLVSFSKRYYQHAWYKNDTLFSNAVNPVYTHHIFKLKDTIKLVVTNGAYSDSTIQYIYFNPPVIINSFTPTSAGTGTTVTINGLNFTGANTVRFGGINAASFSVISNTQINAVVGTGATGSVYVSTPAGYASMSGFTYLAPPNNNLPVSVSKAILCKSESVIITIQNTQTNVEYRMIDSLNTTYGVAMGNGGTITFPTSAITRSGNYTITAKQTGSSQTIIFPNKLFFIVEKTKSLFEANKVNAEIGEVVEFGQKSQEFSTLLWQFTSDASSTTSSLFNPQIIYSATGIKNVKLTATSANGCMDIASMNAIYVYNSSINDSCYAFKLDSIAANGHAYKNMAALPNGGYFVIAKTLNNSAVKSKYGLAKKFTGFNPSYVGCYTSSGILKWVNYIKANGDIVDVQGDANGNIYLLGSILSSDYLYLRNGLDSIRFYTQASDLSVPKYVSFILKLNSNGIPVWHSILYNQALSYTGISTAAGSPKKIYITDDAIAVTGSFGYKLSYYHSGNLQTLYNFGDYTGNTDTKIYTLYLHPNGALKWNAYLEPGYLFEVTDVIIDKHKGLVVSGSYRQSLKVLDAGNIQQQLMPGASNNYQAFIVRYDQSGNFKWSNRLRSSYQFGSAASYDITIDAEGNVYNTGSTDGSISSNGLEIYHSNGNFYSELISGYTLSKFDSLGIHKWTVGSRFPSSGTGSAISITGNNLYVMGRISNGNMPFDITSVGSPSQVHTITSNEFFVVDYDLNGVLNQFRKSGVNSSGNVNPTNLFASANNILIGGNSNLSNASSTPGKLFGIDLKTPSIGDGFVLNLNNSFCSNITMPLKLLNFTAIKNDAKSAILQWATANEVNVSRFEIERSTNALNWKTIGTVAAENGPSNSYSYQDNDISSERIYYRLKMTDLDGTFSYSPIRFLEWNKENSVSIFPNPASTEITIGFERPVKIKGVYLVNATGAKVFASDATIITSKYQLPVSSLISGIYSLIITTSTKVIREKVLIHRK